jgi:hypothetical protein
MKSVQFTKIEHKGDIAFDLWEAIWANNGSNVMIGAPTLELLKARWLEITGLELIVDRAQHVKVIKA